MAGARDQSRLRIVSCSAITSDNSGYFTSHRPFPLLLTLLEVQETYSFLLL